MPMGNQLQFSVQYCVLLLIGLEYYGKDVLVYGLTKIIAGDCGDSFSIFEGSSIYFPPFILSSGSVVSYHLEKKKSFHR